jgi:hypothetical protein
MAEGQMSVPSCFLFSGYQATTMLAAMYADCHSLRAVRDGGAIA